MRVLIRWHVLYGLFGICKLVDINVQMMHGLLCMSRHAHIVLIVYVAWYE